MDNGQPPPVPGPPPRPFYITGGTLRPDAACYVERHADRELHEGLRRGDFCYVLTSRQMGKSSLMVRTVRRLRQEKQHVAVLDLTGIGQNLTVEQWYDGMMARLGQQLDLEDELLDFWREHDAWGPLQRWTTALEKVVLPNRAGQIILFVDEIDIVRSLPFSTDEFFAAIRECHNRRSRDPEYGRLSFCLLGVAAPTDLIRDTRLTPFNIGRRIELNDFTLEEARPLAEGFICPPGAKETPESLLHRVMHWTHGHPYLTQRLCQAVSQAVQAGGAPDVDGICHEMFLSPRARERDDNLLFVRDRILRSESDLAALLTLYSRVVEGKPVPDDESNPLVSILMLSGIARAVNGRLEVRNRIYQTVFDRAWARQNLPGAEVRRQKGAFRKGLLRGLALAVAVFLARSQYVACRTPPPGHSHDATATFSEVRRSWGRMFSYQDQYEASLLIKLNERELSAGGSGYLQITVPNRFKQTFNTSSGTNRIELDYGCDGRRFWMLRDGVREYAVADAPGSWSKMVLHTNLVELGGPLHLAPLFRLWFYHNLAKATPENLSEAPLETGEEYAKEMVIALNCKYDIRDFLAALGWIDPADAAPRKVPLTLWVYPESGLVTRFEVNLTPWATNLVILPPDAALKSLRLAVKLSVMRKNQPIPTSVFQFAPPPDAKRWTEIPAVERRLDLAQIDFNRLQQQIPPRFADTPPQLLDLSPFYNATLREGWHAGARDNDLYPLPSGLLYLGGTLFDVRGIVQLTSKELRKTSGRFPARVEGILVGQKARRLHFLHSCCWSANREERVGTYVIRYGGRSVREVPIRYGEDVLDWHLATDWRPGNPRAARLSRANLVWTGKNHANTEIGLFLTSWDNPLPNTPIERIDFISGDTRAAPFLLGITVER